MFLKFLITRIFIDYNYNIPHELQKPQNNYHLIKYYYSMVYF